MGEPTIVRYLARMGRSPLPEGPVGICQIKFLFLITPRYLDHPNDDDTERVNVGEGG